MTQKCYVEIKKKSFSSNKEIKENFDNKIQQSALIAVLHLVDQRDNNHNLLNGKVIKFSNNMTHFVNQISLLKYLNIFLS